MSFLYQSSSRIQTKKTTSATSSAKNKNKPLISLTPTPSKSRIMRIKSGIDLTSTILTPSNSTKNNSFLEIQRLKDDLHRSQTQLNETVKSYESKLKEAESLINLLRNEIKGQLKEFKNEVLYQKNCENENL